MPFEPQASETHTIVAPVGSGELWPAICRHLPPDAQVSDPPGPCVASYQTNIRGRRVTNRYEVTAHGPTSRVQVSLYDNESTVRDHRITAHFIILALAAVGIDHGLVHNDFHFVNQAVAVLHPLLAVTSLLLMAVVLGKLQYRRSPGNAAADDNSADPLERAAIQLGCRLTTVDARFPGTSASRLWRALLIGAGSFTALSWGFRLGLHNVATPSVSDFVPGLLLLGFTPLRYAAIASPRFISNLRNGVLGGFFVFQFTFIVAPLCCYALARAKDYGLPTWPPDAGVAILSVLSDPFIILGTAFTLFTRLRRLAEILSAAQGAETQTVWETPTGGPHGVRKTLIAYYAIGGVVFWSGATVSGIVAVGTLANSVAFPYANAVAMLSQQGYAVLACAVQLLGWGVVLLAAWPAAYAIVHTVCHLLAMTRPCPHAVPSSSVEDVASNVWAVVGSEGTVRPPTIVGPGVTLYTTFRALGSPCVHIGSIALQHLDREATEAALAHEFGHVVQHGSLLRACWIGSLLCGAGNGILTALLDIARLEEQADEVAVDYLLQVHGRADGLVRAVQHVETMSALAQFLLPSRSAALWRRGATEAASASRSAIAYWWRLVFATGVIAYEHPRRQQREQHIRNYAAARIGRTGHS